MPRQASQNFNASLYTTGASTSKLTTPIVPSPTGFSFGLWLKPLMVGGPTYHYMSYNSAGFTDGVSIVRGAGKSNIEVNIYNGITNICGLNSLSNTAAKDSWIHVAVTYLPSGTCNLYFNGTLKQTLTSTGTMGVAAAQTLVFGNRSYVDAPNGCNLSNIVWQNTTTPWTAQQVLDLYSKGTVPTNATAVYPLNEGAGTIAYDTSGNANNGTITSGTWVRDAPSKTRKAVNDNLVFNGDFEIAPIVNVAQTSGSNYVDGTATGATIPIFGYRIGTRLGTATVQFDTVIKRTGNASIKLSTLAVASDMAVGATMSTTAGGLQIGYPALPSTSYTASVWVKTNYVSGASTSGVRATVVEKNGIGSSGTTNVLLTALQTTQDWTQYNLVFTTASTARSLLFLINVKGDDGAATLIMDAWFDDITLTPTTATTRTANTFPQRKTLANLLSNGNFEYAPPFTAVTTTAARFIDGTATGSSNTEYVYKWRNSSIATSTASASYDSTVYRSGNYSLKLSTTTIGAIAATTYGNLDTVSSIKTSLIPVLPNTTYTISGWAKTNNAAADSVKISIFEFTGVSTSSNQNSSTNTLTGTNDWTLLTLTFTTAGATRYLTVAPRNNVAGNISDAWFDDITLTKVPADARTVVS